jgi:hypothetical protein
MTSLKTFRQPPLRNCSRKLSCVNSIKCHGTDTIKTRYDTGRTDNIFWPFDVCIRVSPFLIQNSPIKGRILGLCYIVSGKLVSSPEALSSSPPLTITEISLYYCSNQNPKIKKSQIDFAAATVFPITTICWASSRVRHYPSETGYGMFFGDHLIRRVWLLQDKDISGPWHLRRKDDCHHELSKSRVSTNSLIMNHSTLNSMMRQRLTPRKVWMVYVLQRIKQNVKLMLFLSCLGELLKTGNPKVRGIEILVPQNQIHLWAVRTTVRNSVVPTKPPTATIPRDTCIDSLPRTTRSTHLFDEFKSPTDLSALYRKIKSLCTESSKNAEVLISCFERNTAIC